MTHRSYSNQSIFSLALASRGLAPTGIIATNEASKRRPESSGTAKVWFVWVMVVVFAAIGLGPSLPTT